MIACGYNQRFNEILFLIYLRRESLNVDFRERIL